ncbi:MAG TPA: inositol monophosphatase family protein, partial [Candidatus Hydrogenedentes bacterium]|nr:inositol monophosphatase family protein [Candidatus Hydrogenedentota bacterium]
PAPPVAVAGRGLGAWSIPLERDPADLAAWRPLSVSRCADPARARLLRSVERGHTNEAQIEQIARRLGVRAEPVLMDSQAKYVSLAAGAGEILLRLLSPDRPDYVEKIWDHAAGWIVLTEAGGKVTDMNGLDLDFTHGRLMRANKGLLATNGILHDAVLQVTRQVTGV